MAKKGKWIIPAVVGVGVLTAAGVALASGGKGTGGGTGTTPAKPATKTPTAPPRGVTKPSRKIAGGGTVWSDPNKDNPASGGPAGGFDFKSNKIWISPNCDEVWEGNLFWDDSEVAPFETVQETLAYNENTQSPNSILGFVAYLIDDEGITQPNDIAWRVVEELSPMCVAVDDPNKSWGPGLLNWYNNFLDRLIPWIEGYTGGIEFGGS